MNTLRFNPPPEWTDPMSEYSSYNRWTFGLFELLFFLKSQGVHAATLVEIGSYMGESTSIFSSSGLFGRVYAIDPWNGYEYFNDLLPKDLHMTWDDIKKEFAVNTRFYNFVVPVESRSEDAVSSFIDNSIDVLYIDGEHTYEAVTNDITDWLPKMKAGGFIAGHDYDSYIWPGVCKAVDEKFGGPNRVFSDTSWVVKV